MSLATFARRRSGRRVVSLPRIHRCAPRADACGGRAPTYTLDTRCDEIETIRAYFGLERVLVEPRGIQLFEG